MLKNLIDKIFVNKKDEILALIRKYKIEDFLDNFVDKLSKISKSDFLDKKVIASSLSSSFLTRINLLLESIDNIDDKEYLEYILSEISNELLFQLLDKSGLNKEGLLAEVKDSLVTTCETNGWNQDDLFKMIKIDMFHSLSVKSNQETLLPGNSSNKIYYYEWLKSEDDLDNLAYSLKDNKIIKSVTEFKKIFSMHSGNISIRTKKDEAEFIIILFDTLKLNDYIKSKGTKGHFAPLKKYFVDFEKKDLIKKEPKRIKEAIRKNYNKHQQIKERVLKILYLQ